MSLKRGPILYSLAICSSLYHFPDFMREDNPQQAQFAHVLIPYAAIDSEVVILMHCALLKTLTRFFSVSL